MPDPRDAELFGVFKEETGLAGGDPYKFGKDGATPGRWKGKQLVVSGSVSGKGKDGMIDKSLVLQVAGDVYRDPNGIQKSLEKRAGAPVPFKPTNAPPAMGRTSGALYGTFGPANGLLDTDASLGRNSGKPNNSSAHNKRNIYVNTPKKGGFGFPDQSRLIGDMKYTYYQEEYCRARTIEKEIRQAAKQSITRPFNFTGRCKPTFSTDSEIYGMPPNASTRGRSASAGPSRPVWKPSNPPAKGPGHGTISKIPYVPDPIREAQYHANDKGAVKAFKPVGGIHKRLSMWAPNPYSYEARPPPDNDLSLL